MKKLKSNDAAYSFRQNRRVTILFIIGQATIDIPQSLNRNYRIVSEDSARKVLSKLEILLKEENKTGDDEILGL